eukprot:gene31565-6753_t
MQTMKLSKGLQSAVRPGRQPTRSVRLSATAEVEAPAGPPPTRAPINTAPPPSHIINVIEYNGQWENGIPPVMGAHLMASGTVAPTSVSKGAGLGVYPPDVAYPTYFLEATAKSLRTSAAPKFPTKAVEQKGVFSLVISGGSLPKMLGSLSSAPIQWDKTHIFFVDERNVPFSDNDSTLKACREELFSKVNVPEANVHAIMENLPTDNQGLPVFDMIILGLGPDGHVASLFPHKSQLTATTSWVLPVTNSPKPPSDRITMTLPVINAAKEVVFFAMGKDKADVVHRALEVQALPGSLPAQLVRPESGTLTWYLNSESAGELSPSMWEDAKAYPRSTFPKPVKADSA